MYSNEQQFNLIVADREKIYHSIDNQLSSTRLGNKNSQRKSCKCHTIKQQRLHDVWQIARQKVTTITQSPTQTRHIIQRSHLQPVLNDDMPNSVMSCDCRQQTLFNCRKQHSGKIRISSTRNKLMTHSTLLCALIVITCSYILTTSLGSDLTGAAATATASPLNGSGKTKKHSSSKTHILKGAYNHQKVSSSSSSSSSPIKFISIKRATQIDQTQKQTQTKDAPSLPMSISREPINNNKQQLTSSNINQQHNSVNSVSKQLAASLISAAASTLAQTATESILLKTTASTAANSSGGATKTGSRTQVKRPSKIYNLPVKFVSNGQPNMFVMGLKHHLASIKKSAANNKKSGLTNNKMGKTPVFKPNSKFIYLPLKYLSNAKPYMVKKGEY